ncbi:MAG: hypothetical protein Ct9H300mP4_13460 [Gammaproteobacteria bacterium]|nr:MAG: hypothetical protein Ct9H300mP4_13460 [Gammaproteobacteria bacterium]
MMFYIQVQLVGPMGGVLLVFRALQYHSNRKPVYLDTAVEVARNLVEFF